MVVLGDMVVFHCSADDATWNFNGGSLPLDIYSFSNHQGDIYSLLVIIRDKSYFGKYICEGEIFDFNLAIYEVGTLMEIGDISSSYYDNALF